MNVNSRPWDIYERTSAFFRNTDKLVEMLGTSINESMIPHSINLTKGVKVSDEDYHQILESIKGFTGSGFEELGLEPCSIEDELNKVCEMSILNHFQICCINMKY